MEDKKTKIIGIIQKLLIHANDQEGTPEGDAFKSKAARMMSKYRIEEADIDLEDDNFIYDTFDFFIDGDLHPQWVGSLVWMFCNTFDCKSVVRKDHTRGCRTWEVIGTFHDVETVLYFIDVVSRHIEKETRKKCPRKDQSKKRNQMGNIAVSIIWQRLHELKKQMESIVEDDPNAKALIIRKMDEVEEAFNELYPGIQPSKEEKFDMPKEPDLIKAGINTGETAPLHFALED